MGRLARVSIWRKAGRVWADGHFVARTAAALPAPPEAPFAGGWGVRVLLQRHPADKVVDEVRCHSEFDESEKKVEAQTPLLLVRFHGVLSFCCSLQRQRYGSVLPGFDKKSPVGAGGWRMGFTYLV